MEVKKVVKVSDKPLASKKVVSKYNIEENLKEKETKKVDTQETTNDNLPKNSFTDQQLNQEWNTFLVDIGFNDQLTHSAIKGFKLKKIDDERIQITYPSSSAKKEFEKVSGKFLQQLKTKLNNHYIKIDYNMDVKSMRKEVMTKKKMFEELCKKNPLLNDLNEFFKFDLN